MLNSNFVYLGSLITFLGGFSYLWDTLQGKIQPNRVSWFLWSLAPLIAFAAEVKQGVGIQALLTFTFGALPALVFLGSFVNKKSFWKIEKVDIICGILSLTGLFLWYITRIGNVAIAFSIMADGLASFPTLIKSFHQPETENSHIFFANTLSAFITLLTVKNWNFQTYGFPVYMIIMMGAIALCIQFKIGKLIKK